MKLILIAIFLVVMSAEVSAYTSPIERDEVVIFFPTIGYPVAKGALWELHIHGWIYEPHWGAGFPDQLRSWLNLGTDNKTPEENTLSKEKMGAFFVDNKGDKQIAVRVGNKEFVFDPSTPNGHFAGWLHLPATEVASLRTGNFITFTAITPANESRHFEGKIQLIESTGISVVSDIDDTIKISEVRDKSAFLANTFIYPFRPVPGMTNLYSAWAKPGNVVFHYVSGSPWQLYLPLTELLSNSSFPPGSFHLRLFRWKDSSFFEFFKSVRPHKIDTISSLIECCLGRHFILVGDSGEQDPEIYAILARKYPQQIVRILIRNVTQEDAEAKRYQETFKDLPKSLWTVFSDPTKVETDLSGFLPK
jgi:phosphatidate phosphatase APP1